MRVFSELFYAWESNLMIPAGELYDYANIWTFSVFGTFDNKGRCVLYSTHEAFILMSNVCNCENACFTMTGESNLTINVPQALTNGVDALFEVTTKKNLAFTLPCSSEIFMNGGDILLKATENLRFNTLRYFFNTGKVTMAASGIGTFVFGDLFNSGIFLIQISKAGGSVDLGCLVNQGEIFISLVIAGPDSVIARGPIRNSGAIILQNYGGRAELSQGGDYHNDGLISLVCNFAAIARLTWCWMLQAIQSICVTSRFETLPQ